MATSDAPAPYDVPLPSLDVAGDTSPRDRQSTPQLEATRRPPPVLGDASLLQERDTCPWCHGPKVGLRKDARYCSKRCRQAAWKFGRVIATAEQADQPLRFAYADPPYPGMAWLYRDHPDYGGEVDHGELIERLVAEYPDGWALSTSAKTLRHVLHLVPAAVDVRIGAWTKPAPPGKTRHARNAWEPVIFAGGRPIPDDAHLLDWVHAANLRRYPGQVTGTKPPAFCSWMFANLGARAGDTLDDLFPGSGAVGRAWAVYTGQKEGAAGGGMPAAPGA